MKRFLDIWTRWRAVFVTLLAFLVLWIMKSFFTIKIPTFSPITKAIEDFSMTDLFYEMDDNNRQENSFITIVDMTELTNRGDIAHALEQVEACEPLVVGVDMVFQGLKDDSLGNEALRHVAANYPNIIWSLRLYDYDNKLGYTYPDRSFFIEETGATEAVTNMLSTKVSRVKRKLVRGWELNGELKPAFVCSVANMYAGEEIAPTEGKDLDINFTPTDFTVVPWNRVAQNADLLADRIVLFGAMHEEGDMHITPLGKMAGLELLAYGVQTLINNNEVREVSHGKLLLYSFLIVLLVYLERSWRRDWIGRRRNPLARLLLNFPIVGSLISFIWVGLIMFGAYLIFVRYNTSFNLGYAFGAIAFLVTAESSYTIIHDYLKDKVNEKDNR